MTNPDLQNYINSAKQQGLTDEQIRQNLLAQGWQQTDLNEAFAQQTISPTSTVVPATTSMFSAKIIVSVILALIILGAGGYFVYSKISNQTTSQESPAPNSNTTATQSQNNQAQTPAPKPPTYNESSCGELPRGGSAYYTQSSSPPADYPTDIPMYSNGHVAGYYIVPGKTSKLVYLAVCTDDSIDKVAAYFISNGAAWNIENPYVGSVNNNIRGSVDNGKDLIGYQDNKKLMIGITNTGTGAKTWIVSEIIFKNN